MTDIAQFLKEIISAPGISGYESALHPLIEKAWSPVTDKITYSKLGSLHGLQRGTGLEPRKSILVAAHLDAIGLMVSAIVDGFLRVTTIGGIDARVLPGQMVTVHGRKDLPGMLVASPVRLLPSSVQGATIPLEYILVDVGLLPEDVAQLVRVGDTISFAQQPVDTAGGTLVGHTLDNRASVAALTHCLELLHARPHPWDVWAVATVQEEVTMGGGLTSAFQLQPSLAVAIDVTFGTSPNVPGHLSFPLGKGPTLEWGPDIHPFLCKSLKALAEQLDIPISLEPTPRHSGTDAYMMQIAGAGIPTAVIGIPLRYMHTPVEMIALKDIMRAGRLIAEFIAQLGEDFMEKLTWDD
ncbi:MAG: M20/M25/M40 family metallo-hydrolase [Acidobacteriaceae bacterium]